jgi:competence protein ComEA
VQGPEALCFKGLSAVLILSTNLSNNFSTMQTTQKELAVKLSQPVRVMLFLAVLVLSSVSIAEQTAVESHQLDLNQATVMELEETLQGVGQHKAQAIVDWRDEYGPFKSVDDLVKVKGVGPGTLEKNRFKLTVR